MAGALDIARALGLVFSLPFVLKSLRLLLSLIGWSSVPGDFMGLIDKVDEMPWWMATFLAAIAWYGYIVGPSLWARYGRGGSSDRNLIRIRDALEIIARHHLGGAWLGRASIERHHLCMALSTLTEEAADQGADVKVKGQRWIEPNDGYNDVFSDWEWIDPKYWKTHEIDFNLVLSGWVPGQFETTPRNILAPASQREPRYRLLRVPEQKIYRRWPPPLPWVKAVWRDAVANQEG